MPRPSRPRKAIRSTTAVLTTLLLVTACASTAPRPAPVTPTSPAPTTAPAPTSPAAPAPAAGALAATTAAGPPPAATPPPTDILATVPAITAAELEPRLASAGAPLVLDVRTPEEYAAGHVPGARLIPHDQLATRLAELAAARDQDQEVIVYCRTGRRAALAIDTLQRAGFSRVGHLQGDYQGWSAEGRAVAMPAAAVAPATPAAD